MMPVRISTSTERGVAAKETVQLTEEQKAKLNAAFIKAIADTLGQKPVAWLSGGFSKA
jgi:hypothetical protein